MAVRPQLLLDPMIRVLFTFLMLRREKFSKKTLSFGSLDPVVLPWSENWTVPALVRRGCVTGSVPWSCLGASCVLPGRFCRSPSSDFAQQQSGRSPVFCLLDGTVKHKDLLKIMALCASKYSQDLHQQSPQKASKNLIMYNMSDVALWCYKCMDGCDGWMPGWG